MRFREFKTLKEGSKSDVLRYSSEVGMLAGFCGANISQFDPKNPQASIPAQALSNPQNTYADIVKFLAPNYDPVIFEKFYNIAQNYYQIMLNQLSTLNEPAPTVFEWSGGSNINPEGAADVIFANHPTVHGVSIKAESGITLKNLGPSSVGLSAGEDVVEHPDVFARFAEPEWNALKKYAIDRVLDIAKRKPNTVYAPIKPKYAITYIKGQIPVTAKKVTKPAKPATTTTPAVDNQNTKLAVSKQTIGQEPQTQMEDQQQPALQGYFKIDFKGRSVNKTEQQIYDESKTNGEWQRVFGDHVQSQWNKDSNIRNLGNALFSSISEIFVQKIQSALLVKEKLQKILAMGKKGYFYSTPSELYFVPGVEQVDNLVLKSLKYGTPDGTAQKFIAKIGVEGGEDEASLLVYVRYANGMFEANPTVRIQDLKNPGALTWTKLV